ncbi:hypothetical protein IKF67_02105 [Candidatus Saccharibacteria bacterium]|nr:hypothetical protein [Candidatus Saccharibacteria bacterium]
MPSWNIHLEAGERLLKKLKFSKAEQKEFLFGCILPDINNGYINKVKIQKDHNETHYAFNQKSSLNFYAENKTEIQKKDPIFLGYLFHLYTDGFFNYDFYRTIKHHKLGEGLTHPEKRKIKHHDFWIYDTNFHHHFDFSQNDIKHLTTRANLVPTTDITPEDIKNVQQVLNSETLNESIKNEKYLLYDKTRLDNLMDDMIESFINDYIKD